MENITPRVEVATNPETEGLLNACRDLNSACTMTSTRYLVVGSVASVCAVGEMYRVPADVDSWYDSKNASELRDALTDKGYEYKVDEDSKNAFPNPLERFIKGDSIIELRGADFTDRGIEYPMRIPIPGVPLERRPHGTLVFTSLLAEPQESNLGGNRIITSSKESLWVGLQTSLPLIELYGEKVEKRLSDLEKLGEGLNVDLVEKMLAQKPGLYFGKTPIVTADNKGLIKFITQGMRLKSKVGS